MSRILGKNFFLDRGIEGGYNDRMNCLMIFTSDHNLDSLTALLHLIAHRHRRDLCPTCCDESR